MFCKHCSVAAGMLINRKRQRCAEWDSIWNMSNGVSSRPGRLVTGTSEQSRFWTTSNEHWGNEFEFLHPSQYLVALYVRGVQQSHYLNVLVAMTNLSVSVTTFWQKQVSGAWTSVPELKKTPVFRYNYSSCSFYIANMLGIINNSILFNKFEAK